MLLMVALTAARRKVGKASLCSTPIGMGGRDAILPQPARRNYTRVAMMMSFLSD